MNRRLFAVLAACAAASCAPAPPAVVAPAAPRAPAPIETPPPPPSAPAPLGPLRARARVDELGRMVFACADGDPMLYPDFALRGDACSFHGAIRALTRSTGSVCVDAREPCTRELQTRVELALADAPAAQDERCPRDPGAPHATTSSIYVTVPARLAARALPLAVGETVCGYVDQHGAPYGCGKEEVRLSRASGEIVVAYGTAPAPNVPGFRFAVGHERSRWSSDGSVHVEMSALLSRGGATRELFKDAATLAGAATTEYEVAAVANMTQHTHVYECARPAPVVTFSIVQLAPP